MNAEPVIFGETFNASLRVSTRTWSLLSSKNDWCILSTWQKKLYECQFSMQAAIEQATMLNHHYTNGSVSMDGVEDLSMKSSRNNSSDNLRKLGSPSR